MDRTGADFEEAMKSMDEYLDANAVPFQLPIGAEDDFTGIVDVIEQKAFIFQDYERVEADIPEEYLERAKAARELLIEKIADFDDSIAEKFLEEEDISVESLKIAARKAALKLLITPVFCGAAYKNKGVQLLLDAVVDYLPSPVDIGAIVANDFDDEEKPIPVVLLLKILLQHWRLN